MTKNLDDMHKKIFDFFKKNQNKENITLREIWWYIWKDIHPQKISNKIQQLEKMWYLRKNFEKNSYDIIEEPIKDMYLFPLYWYAQCGNNKSNIAIERPIKEIPFSTAVLWIKDPENYFFVKAKGKSMEPDIKDWDLILVRRQPNYELGTRVLVVHNEDLKIKRIALNEGKWILISDNKEDNPDLEIQDYDDTNVIWIIKKTIKNF